MSRAKAKLCDWSLSHNQRWSSFLFSPHWEDGSGFDSWTNRTHRSFVPMSIELLNKLWNKDNWTCVWGNWRFKHVETGESQTHETKTRSSHLHRFYCKGGFLQNSHMIQKQRNNRKRRSEKWENERKTSTENLPDETNYDITWWVLMIKTDSTDPDGERE